MRPLKTIFSIRLSDNQKNNQGNDARNVIQRPSYPSIWGRGTRHGEETGKRGKLGWNIIEMGSDGKYRMKLISWNGRRKKTEDIENTGIEDNSRTVIKYHMGMNYHHKLQAIDTFNKNNSILSSKPLITPWFSNLMKLSAADTGFVFSKLQNIGNLRSYILFDIYCGELRCDVSQKGLINDTYQLNAWYVFIFGKSSRSNKSVLWREFENVKGLNEVFDWFSAHFGRNWPILDWATFKNFWRKTRNLFF